MSSMDRVVVDKKTILLTGGTGFLGSNLLKRLVVENFNVILLKRSFSNTHRIDDVLSRVKFYNSDRDDLGNIFKEQKIDVILHCATDYGRKQVGPLQIIEANLLLPLKLLQLGKDNGVKYFINTDTVLDKRVSHYSLSKKQFIDWLKTYKDMICVNIALEHFYGPGDDKTKFISYVFEQLYQKVPSIDFTLGEQLRDFVYIDDVVEAFLFVLNHLDTKIDSFVQYEIGTNNPVSIKELVGYLKVSLNNTNTLLNFGALPYRENEVMCSAANTDEIRRLGWVPKFDWRCGIDKMVSLEKQIRSKLL